MLPLCHAVRTGAVTEKPVEIALAMTCSVASYLHNIIELLGKSLRARLTLNHHNAPNIMFKYLHPFNDCCQLVAA